jgi:O-antigen/teichoic acid export membrane protein
VLTFLGQSGGFVVAILTGVLAARSLGPSGKGVLALCALLLAVFTTYGDGIQSAIMFQIGRRPEAESAVYGASLRLIGVVFVPLAILLFAVGVAVPRFATWTFVACALPFAVYAQVVSAFMLLRNKVSSTIVLGAINTFGYAAVVSPALLIWHVGASGVLAIWALMYFLSGVYAFFQMSSMMAAKPKGATTNGILVEQAWFSFKSGSVSVASFLNLRVDIFVVGLMLDTHALGIYSLGVATVEMMWQLTRPLGWTTIGRIAVAGRTEAIALTAMVTRNILAVSTLAGAILFLIAPLAVPFVYGRAFAESGDVVRWLIPGVIFYAANGTLGYYVMVKEGRPLLMFLVQAGSVVACAGITSLSIHSIGIYGAALATSVTYLLATLAKAVAFTQLTGASPLSFTILRTDDIQRYRRITASVSRGGLKALFPRRV